MKWAFALLLLLAPAAQAETIILASTTSVENAGLLARILPGFTARSGIIVHVLAQGSGQALATAARGDADLVLVHDPEAEAEFMASGHGLRRVEIAWNDFLLVGPAADPAGLKGTTDAVAALAKVAATASPFISRGDRSGTDALEKRLWREAAIQPAGRPWYKEIGGGMGAALNMAAAIDAITLTDRGTWLAFGNRRSMVELTSGDPRLINRYRVIELNPARHPTAHLAAAHALAEYLASPEGQTAIAAVTIEGEALFRPGVRVVVIGQ